MTISTYTELQQAVTNWLDDTSISSRITEFITMGESRINRDLGQIRTAWSNTTLTGTTSSRSLALPADFVEAQALFLTTSNEQQQLAPFINGTVELKTTEGTPYGWSINGANIDLDCPCDQAHTFSLRYRSKWELSDLAPTNWLLTNHPDLYLAVSLYFGYTWRGETNMMAASELAYKRAVDEVETKEARSLAITPLRVDVTLRNAGRFNFTTGE